MEISATDDFIQGVLGQCFLAPVGAAEGSPRRQPWEGGTLSMKPRRGERITGNTRFLRPCRG